MSTKLQEGYSCYTMLGLENTHEHWVNESLHSCSMWFLGIHRTVRNARVSVGCWAKRYQHLFLPLHFFIV